MKKIEEFLTPTQRELFRKLTVMYENAVVRKGSYILVPGKAPVMLVAHLDTVHREPVKTICRSDNGNILMSPEGIGGDDRCGVYALVTAHERAAVKPWLLFTCDEEVGGVGASAFCAEYDKGKMPKGLSSLKAIIEIDRKGRDDAVYYDCANTDFESYITKKGFKTQFGSFSDISVVAPKLGVAAVNLSSGYYNAHTQHEYINQKHLNTTIRKVVEIIADAVKQDFPTYEYVESICFSRFGGRRYEGWWDGYTYQRGDKVVLFDDEDCDLKDVPESIRPEYELLLDYAYYSVEELEAIRAEQGDRAIQMLAESEFGDDYYDLMYSDADTEDLR